MESYSEHMRLNGMSSEHGSVPVVATDRNYVRRAHRAEGVLHALGEAGIITEQNAGEE